METLAIVDNALQKELLVYRLVQYPSIVKRMAF
jgi:hypothetical protein